MSKQNFINQFKNTRRLTGLQGRHPLGGKARLDFKKAVPHPELKQKKPFPKPHPEGKIPPGHDK
jgi:hypothetical protein